MPDASLSDAIAAAASVPAGRWAIGVSGGADSVALLELLRDRPNLTLHVVHLDHETRGKESAADAEFVRNLARKYGVPATIARRSEIEGSMSSLEKNPSARYRAARLEVFRRVVEQHQLGGVILAHHADDQAETVMQRLLRGAGRAGLTGMSARSSIGRLVVLRPLLAVKRSSLRQLMTERGVAWREDASNQSGEQQRNRVRPLLDSSPALAASLTQLASACHAVGEWLSDVSPQLGESFPTTALQNLSPPLARESAKQWLALRGGANVEITARTIERLLEMATDAASPSRQNFPGKILVRRRSGVIEVVH